MRSHRSTEDYLRYLISGGTKSEWGCFLVRAAMVWLYRGIVLLVVFILLGPYLNVLVFVSVTGFMAYGGVAFLALSLLEDWGVYTPPLWLSLFKEYTAPLRWLDGLLDTVAWLWKK